MEKIKQLIIIGGGYSIKEGIEKDLWNKLENRFVIGLNDSYRDFKNPTIQCYVDRDYYLDQCKNELWLQLPLIIGKYYDKTNYLPNTITLRVNPRYYRDVRLGCYKDNLLGTFALSLGIFLLDEGEIFLLGYDNRGIDKKDSNGRTYTHYYQDDKSRHHRGIGKVDYYNNIIHKKMVAGFDFKPYQSEQLCKIYNVSSISVIPDTIFPKLNYDQFFQMLDKNILNQDELRNNIKLKLK